MRCSRRLRRPRAPVLVVGLIASCAGLAGCQDRNVGAVKVPASQRAGMTDRLGGGIGPVSRKVQKASSPVEDENIKRRIGAGK